MWFSQCHEVEAPCSVFCSISIISNNIMFIVHNNSLSERFFFALKTLYWDLLMHPQVSCAKEVFSEATSPEIYMPVAVRDGFDLETILAERFMTVDNLAQNYGCSTLICKLSLHRWLSCFQIIHCLDSPGDSILCQRFPKKHWTSGHSLEQPERWPKCRGLSPVNKILLFFSRLFHWEQDNYAG